MEIIFIRSAYVFLHFEITIFNKSLIEYFGEK